MDDHQTTSATPVERTALGIPFNHEKLDALMDEAGIDALVATSKHNIQYLLGGYRFFFFDYMDAIGVSRYLPVFVYPKGRPDQAAISATGSRAMRNSSTSSGRQPSKPQPPAPSMQCG